MKQILVALVALCASSHAVSGARILRGAAPTALQASAPASHKPSQAFTDVGRKLSQFIDDLHIPGERVMSNQMWLSRHSKGGKEPILYNDYQSAARANDTNYMLDAQATFTQKKTNFEAVKDLLRNDVTIASTNAPDKMESGGAADVNNIAQGTMAIWTTAVMAREEDLRYSLGLDYSQAAVQAAMDNPDKDVTRATNTAQIHAMVASHPTGMLNW